MNNAQDQAAAAAAPASLPPVGTVAAYEYDSAYPTPGKRTQLVLVTGHEPPAEDGSQRIRGLVLADVADQASFTVDQLAPV